MGQATDEYLWGANRGGAEEVSDRVVSFLGLLSSKVVYYCLLKIMGKGFPVFVCFMDENQILREYGDSVTFPGIAQIGGAGDCMTVSPLGNEIKTIQYSFIVLAFYLFFFMGYCVWAAVESSAAGTERRPHESSRRRGLVAVGHKEEAKKCLYFMSLFFFLIAASLFVSFFNLGTCCSPCLLC